MRGMQNRFSVRCKVYLAVIVYLQLAIIHVADRPESLLFNTRSHGPEDFRRTFGTQHVTQQQQPHGPSFADGRNNFTRRLLVQTRCHAGECQVGALLHNGIPAIGQGSQELLSAPRKDHLVSAIPLRLLRASILPLDSDARRRETSSAVSWEMLLITPRTTLLPRSRLIVNRKETSIDQCR